ncbi:MAG TPA: isoamylase early set domain-containing protein [Gemmatimonadaceae bacterium]|nr:isoamylase early set domain-containing protein [Gemmatimonadaceae bacterium]
MIDETDELIQRAARSLKALPATNPLANARIIAAVRARRAQTPSRIVQVAQWMREPTLSAASAAFLAAAALVVGFVAGGALRTADGTSPEIAATTERPVPPGPAPALSAANTHGDVAVALLFEARNAKSVAVVGDFNNWDATSSPMKRFGSDGPWTTTVRAKPGRHVYAFLVDGTTVVADPRAPRARDLDYGGDASVLMVTTP